MNILEQANHIVFARGEEKHRQYGDFETSLQKAADLFNIITGASLDARDVALVNVAVKLSRESHRHKRDNILDAIAYLAMSDQLTDDEVNKKQDLQFELGTHARAPVRGTVGSAGLDFYIPDDFVACQLQQGESILIDLQIKCKIPKNHALVAFNKSGVSTKKGLTVGACVIDSDYTGTIHAHMWRFAPGSCTLKPGDKIVQFLLLPINMRVEGGIGFTKGDAREDGGFGSTGDTHE